MGTLGCINDMLQRDKENRELRKLNRERMKERQNRLMENGKSIDMSNITIEKMEEIQKKTIEKKNLDSTYLSKVKIAFAICALLIVLLGWLISC